jgi:hypothetical protein
LPACASAGAPVSASIAIRMMERLNISKGPGSKEIERVPRVQI